MKRLVNVLILLFGISFVLTAISGMVKLECIFKYIFNISCPGCGLTRSFKAIINLDFYSAIRYNILGIPLFIIGIIACIGLVIDIIKNNNRTINYIFNFFKNYYIVIIILLIITMIINNINGI